MSIDFGALLSRAWKITWEHKVLWIFGILSALGGGGNSLANGNSYRSSGRDFEGRLPFGRIERFFDQIPQNTMVAIIVGLVCLIVLLAVVFFVLSIIGRGGLIGGVQLAEVNGRVTFGEAWSQGLHNFWRLFFIGLIVGVVGLVVAVLLALPGVICFPLLCLIPIVLILLGILAYFAQIAAVVEDKGVTEAFQRAWEVMRANVGPIVILGLILIVISFVVGVVFVVPVIVAFLPAIFAIMSDNEAGLTTGLIISGLCFVAYLPVLLVLSGVLQTWVTSAWTLAYRQFIRPAAAPDLAPAAPTITS